MISALDQPWKKQMYQYIREAKVVYMSSSFCLWAPESRDLSQAEK